MRGDLHTLERVCSYASVVMLAGSIVFMMLAVSCTVLGLLSFSSPDIREMFSSLIKCRLTDISVAAGTVEMVVAFITAAVSLKLIHGVMVTTMDRSSPFVMENADRFKKLSLLFLGSSVILAIFEYLNRSDAVLTSCLFLFCILICVVMYCLTIVFRYGSALQTESDYTL